MCLCRSCSRLNAVDGSTFCYYRRKCRDECPDYEPLSRDRPPCKNGGLKITLYGDSCFALHDAVLAFEYCNRLIVCDFSECGAYMACGLMKSVKKPREVRLEDVLAEDPFAEVEAPGSDGARRLLHKSGARTAAGLFSYLASRR